MISIQLPAQSVAVAHPDVAACQCFVAPHYAVAAVMLRPLYGRQDRRRVLAEVARMVAESACPRGVESASSGNVTDTFVVYVVADVDVYQSLLHGSPVDTELLAKRTGCHVLVLTVPAEDDA